MKRMRRIIFDTLTIVSLVFGGAAAILWVESYREAEEVYFATLWHLSASRVSF
jgi:hypothetical protein